MTRYFVETNVLAGLTYPHDRWHRDVRPLYEHNTLYTSQFVLYEYCNQRRTDPSVVADPNDLRTDPDGEWGKYRHLEKKLEDKIPFFDKRIRELARSGLSLADVIEAYLDHFEIREQAEPQVRQMIRDYFVSRDVTARNARRCVQSIRDDILLEARQKRAELVENVHIMDSVYDRMETERQWIDDHIGIGPYGVSEEDLQWVLDAVYLKQQGVLSALVTGDKNDVAQFKNELHDLFGLSVLYASEEFYTDTLSV